MLWVFFGEGGDRWCAITEQPLVILRVAKLKEENFNWPLAGGGFEYIAANFWDYTIIPTLWPFSFSSLFLFLFIIVVLLLFYGYIFSILFASFAAGMVSLFSQVLFSPVLLLLFFVIYKYTWLFNFFLYISLLSVQHKRSWFVSFESWNWFECFLWYNSTTTKSSFVSLIVSADEHILLIDILSSIAMEGLRRKVIHEMFVFCAPPPFFWLVWS